MDLLECKKNVDEPITDKGILGNMSIEELLRWQATKDSMRSTTERGSEPATVGAKEDYSRSFEGPVIHEPPRKKDDDSSGDSTLSSDVGPKPGSLKSKRQKVRELKKGDIKRLQELESIVTEGAKSSVTSGCALFEIYSRERGLFWKSKYSSFDLYCHEKWGYKKSQCYRLLKIGKFMDQLKRSPNGYPEDQMPTNECQVRPILEWLKKDHRVKCWNSIVAEIKPAELTGKVVQERVSEYRKEHGLDVKKPRPVIPRIERVFGAFEKLGEILKEFPDGESSFKEILGIVEQLIKEDAKYGTGTLPLPKETPAVVVEKAAPAPGASRSF